MPKKRKAKKKQPTQKQSQRQSVVVNIGSTRKPRKASGKGGLPPPSYAHNLAPTFVTAPQVDYTPLLAMMQHNASRLVAQAPMASTQTPLSSTLIASNAEQMAGKAAVRRAGPMAEEMAVATLKAAIQRRAGKTAGNFQPLPSQADERLAVPSPFTPKDNNKKPIKTITKLGGEGKGYVPVKEPIVEEPIKKKTIKKKLVRV
jgi:hypothetical protein